MTLTPDSPSVSTDCCAQWGALIPLFTWKYFLDFPGLMAMPSLGKIRVNYCPSCGAAVRNFVTPMDRRARVPETEGRVIFDTLGREEGA